MEIPLPTPNCYLTEDQLRHIIHWLIRVDPTSTAAGPEHGGIDGIIEFPSSRRDAASVNTTTLSTRGTFPGGGAPPATAIPTTPTSAKRTGNKRAPQLHRSAPRVDNT